MKKEETVLRYMDEHRQEAYDLLLELAQIPAPSNQEEKRAEFCKNWLQAQGCKGVYVDEALNVIWPVGCTDSNDLAVYMAHTREEFVEIESLLPGLKVAAEMILHHF